jgi:hypothetical protein
MPRATILAILLLVTAVPSLAQQPAAPPQLSGTSSYRLLPRTANCTFGFRTTNQRYTVVGSLLSEGNPPHLVLEERTTLEQCENLEGPSLAEVRVTARPAGRPTAPAVWTIRREADRGEVVDSFPGQPVYRIKRYGCCGSEDVDAWYSLATGRLLFTADYPLLSVDVEPFGSGLVGVHDTEAATPPGAERDSTLIAVIAWGRASGAVQKLALRGASWNFAVRNLELVARGPAGQLQRSQHVDIDSGMDPRWTLAVSFTLESMDDSQTRGRVELPLVRGALVPGQAHVTGPFRLVPLTAPR